MHQMQASISNLANAAAVVALASNGPGPSAENSARSNNSGSLIDIKLSEDMIRNVIGSHSNSSNNAGLMVDVRNSNSSSSQAGNADAANSTSSETIDNLSSPIEYKHGDILNGDSSFLGNGKISTLRQAKVDFSL